MPDEDKNFGGSLVLLRFWKVITSREKDLCQVEAEYSYFSGE